MNVEYAVFSGLDVGKGEHHGCALDPSGNKLRDKPLPNDEQRLRALFTQLGRHGLLVVVDQPASIGALAVAVARDEGCQVAYLPGLTMRRRADLHPSNAKTDARDAFVIADAARTLPHSLRRVDTGQEALAELEVLVGFDDDLAGESTRLVNRIRGLLVTIHPALRGPWDQRLHHPTALELLITYGGPDGLRAGLAPVTRRSGSSIKGEHPPKGDNKALKRAIFLAAFTSLSDPLSRAYYDRKRAEDKKHNAALICLSRRRSDVIYAMLRNKQPYQPTRKPTARAA